MQTTTKQQRRDERRSSTMKRCDNEKARKYFTMYYDILDFLEEKQFNISDLDEKLRVDTLRNAATILHEEAMELEYPTEITVTQTVR